jgi:hypothetical protein
MARGRNSAGDPNRLVDQASLQRRLRGISRDYEFMFGKGADTLPTGDVTPLQVEAAEEHYHDDVRRHLMGKPWRSPHLDRDLAPARAEDPTPKYGMTLEEYRMREAGAKRPKTGWGSEDPFPYGMRSITD